ncbi:TRAP transporter small permease [Solibacillus silvestris]|uniref:TRAP transporter small permease n=1 Tax=Solibacillus silvestris TaxID=76853 RepID=UPI003F7D7068
MKLVATISNILYKFEKFLAVLLMATMLGSIALGVVFRYLFGNPLTWSDELAVYMLIWLTFLGGSMSVKTMRAASLDLLFERVSLFWKRVFLIVGYAVVVAFAAIVAYMAIQWISNPSIKTQLSPGLKISMFMPYLAVPFGLTCMLIHAFHHFLQGFVYEEVEIGQIGEGGDAI